MAWQLQQAKQQFSEVVRRAQSEGEQVVTKHGRPAVVIVDFEEYKAARAEREPKKTFVEHLLSAPKLTDEEWEIAFGHLDQPEPVPYVPFTFDDEPEGDEA